jgi:hypothetical protein
MFGRLGESPQPSKELLDETATGVDADPDEAVDVGPAVPRRRCQSVPKSVACTASVLLTVLFAITFMRRPSLTQTVGVTSLAAGVGNSLVAEQTGCKNWHSSSLEVQVVSDEDACVDLCRDIGGCVGVNYQVTDCPQLPHKSEAERACYLMNEECIEGPNECWNLYKLPEDERTTSLFGALVTHGAGCKNIADISKGGPTTEFSEFVCQNKCEKDADCVGYLLKAPGCDGDDNDKGQVCQLLYGLCEEDPGETFACWDIKYKAVHESSGADIKNLFHLSEPSDVGATLLSVTNSSCFRVGDTVELFHEEEDFTHQYEVTSVDPFAVSPPLTHWYATGTGVLRIHYPYSASHCGAFPETVNEYTV